MAADKEKTMINTTRILNWATWVLFLTLVTGCETRHVQLIREIEIATDTVTETVEETSTATNKGIDTSKASDSDSGINDSDSTASCEFGANRIRVTELDVGEIVVANEEEAALMPIVISPVPSGGSRLAWMGDDGAVHITTLNQADEIVRNDVSILANDFQDLYATSDGGVLLLTRAAQGGGTLNCGNQSNLCIAPNAPVPCFDMYMVKFDDQGEDWATQLTNSSETLPPYSTGPTGASVSMIWWYAHHGKIASSGSSYAAYFGSAISVSSGSCIDIHQGDRMQVVSEGGKIIDGGFHWGCSPSGYEQIIWNSAAHAYVSVCKSDTASTGVVAFAPEKTAIWNVDPWYSNIGELVLAENGGYWLALSDRKAGQSERSNGLAEVHLLQFTSDKVNIQKTVTSDNLANVRSPHIAKFGQDTLLLLYESSTSPGELAVAEDRTSLVELRSTIDGTKTSETFEVANFNGHRYHAMRTFSNGSVAMAVKGDDATTIKILRFLPCGKK